MIHILVTTSAGTTREWFAPDEDLPGLRRLLDRYLATTGRTIP